MSSANRRPFDDALRAPTMAIVGRDSNCREGLRIGRFAQGDDPPARGVQRGQFLLSRFGIRNGEITATAASSGKVRQRVERAGRGFIPFEEIFEEARTREFCPDQTQPVDPLGVAQRCWRPGHKMTMIGGRSGVNPWV